MWRLDIELIMVLAISLVDIGRKILRVEIGYRADTGSRNLIG